jgi:hypothetical protein
MSEFLVSISQQKMTTMLIVCRNFKYYRLVALSHVVNGLQHAEKEARLQPASLAMGALMIYLFNALLYRPAEGRAEQILLNTACRHQLDNDGHLKPILYGSGLYFLADIGIEGVYHLPPGRELDSKYLEVLYRRDSMMEIEEEFTHHASQESRKLGPSQGRQTAYLSRKQKMKRKMTFLVNGTPSDDEENEESEMAEEDKALKMGRRLEAIWRQFPSDILQLAPAPKKSTSGSTTSPWILLDEAERNQATISIFQSLERLRKVFRQATYKVMTDEEWNTILFQRYFPPPGTEDPKDLQGFPRCNYYRQWRLLMTEAHQEEAQMARELVLKWFGGLHWLPHAMADRLWSTQKMKSQNWKKLQEEEACNCPVLAINSPHYQHNVFLKEEEEESDGGN